MRRVLLPFVALALVAAACTGGDGEDGRPAVTSSPAVNAAEAPLLPTDALALPDFTYDAFKQLLSQLHGTPVVVNVWGSWCGPCREEGPHLAAAARRYGDRVQFLGIDTKDTRDGARAFMLRMHWTYPSVFDPSPDGTIHTQLGYFGVPVTIFYDANGGQVDDFSGPIDASDLEAGIRKIL